MSKLALAAFTAFALAFSAQAPAQDAKKDPSAKKAAQKGSLAGQDLKYLREMTQTNLAEVQAGKLGASQASSGEVKKFAQHMVDDHGTALSENRRLAKSKGVQAPSAPAKKHQNAMKRLESAAGAEFDKTFMTQMVKDHEEALKLHQDAAKNAKDKDLKAAAEKSVPVVQKHLEMAKSIAASLK